MPRVSKTEIKKTEIMKEWSAHGMNLCVTSIEWTLRFLEPSFDSERHEKQTTSDTYRQEGMDNVSFDRTQRFVSDNHKDLLLLLQANEVPKPGLLGQPGRETGNWWERTPRAIENTVEPTAVYCLDRRYRLIHSKIDTQKQATVWLPSSKISHCQDNALNLSSSTARDVLFCFVPPLIPWPGTYSGLDSGVRLDMSSDVGTEGEKSRICLQLETRVNKSVYTTVISLEWRKP